MNKTVYYDDPYCSRLEGCTITSVEKKDGKFQVTTDQTIFYPECGGQPGDIGCIQRCYDGDFSQSNIVDVLDTQKAPNGDSVLILREKDNYGDASKIKVGDKYNLALDWAHRHKFMAIHTAQHMLSGLLYSKFNIGTVSVHQGEDYLTIETDMPEIPHETIDELIDIANRIIREGHKVVYHKMSHARAEKLGLRRSIKVEGDVRIVEICGVDKIACGGVQVASTSEIQLVSYYTQEQIRGHVRLFFRVGDTAIKYYQELDKSVASWTKSLGCSISEFGPKLEKLNQQLAEAKLKLAEVSSKAAFNELKTRISENGVVSFETEIELPAYLNATEKFENIAMCVVNQEHWLIVLGGRFASFDFNVLKKELFLSCGAKGGGRNGVFQGVLMSSKTAEFIAGFNDLVKSL